MSNPVQVELKKLTYALDGYIHDYNEQNYGDANGWLRHVRDAWEGVIEVSPDSLDPHEFIEEMFKEMARKDARNIQLQRLISKCVEEVDAHYQCIKNLADDSIMNTSLMCSLATADAMRNLVREMLGVRDD